MNKTSTTVYWRVRSVKLTRELKSVNEKLAEQNNIIKELENTIEGWELADKEQRSKLAKIREILSNPYLTDLRSCKEIREILNGDKRG